MRRMTSLIAAALVLASCGDALGGVGEVWHRIVLRAGGTTQNHHEGRARHHRAPPPPWPSRRDAGTRAAAMRLVMGRLGPLRRSVPRLSPCPRPIEVMPRVDIPRV